MLQHTPVVALSDPTLISPTLLPTMTSSLDTLVDDILIQIFQALSVRALLSLRKTSRRYYLLSKLRCIWHVRFYTDVWARRLPLPGPSRPLSLLSVTELEQRTLRALYLEQAWPRLSTNTLVSTHDHPYGAGARVDQVVFIPGGTELLTVRGDTLVHWLIVDRSGVRQGLEHVGEWTPFEGVPCRIVKDGDVPGVIAVGPKEPWRSPWFAKIFSTSMKAPFVTLCTYPRVPGVLAGIWRHLLLLDTTRERDEGGLELLDWHAQTTGTAVLPRHPDLFGRFLDFAVFSGSILVVWEYCVSVFPVPRVPANGQVVVEHTRVFMFREAMSRPVGFTTCVARHIEPSSLDSSAYLGRDADWDRDAERKRRLSSAMHMSPTLTIAARSRVRAESVSMVMLVPLVDDDNHEEETTPRTNAFSYRLAYLPPHLPSTVPSGQHAEQEGVPEDSGEDDTGGDVSERVPRACTTLRLGWSGRGVFVVGGELRLVSPGLLILPPYEMQFGPVFETGEALYVVDRLRRRDVDRGHSGGNADLGGDGVDRGNGSGDRVDFDEGMGRFVVARERGGFDVVQLD